MGLLCGAEINMSRKREFGEGPLYTISNYIMWFFVGNLYFILCSIPFWFIILGFNGKFTTEYAVLLTLFSLPIGPAYTALLSVMGKLVREKDVNMTKDYFSAYKKNFLQALFLWAVEIVIIVILIIDIKFFLLQSVGKIIVPILYGIIFIVLLAGVYVYPILSRFYLKSIDIIKLSFYYIAAKLKVTITCIAIVIIAYGILTKVTSAAALFIVSIICYGIMFMQQDVLKELEIKINPEANREESEE